MAPRKPTSTPKTVFVHVSRAGALKAPSKKRPPARSRGGRASKGSRKRVSDTDNPNPWLFFPLARTPSLPPPSIHRSPSVTLNAKNGSTLLRPHRRTGPTSPRTSSVPPRHQQPPVAVAQPRPQPDREHAGHCAAPRVGPPPTAAANERGGAARRVEGGVGCDPHVYRQQPVRELLPATGEVSCTQGTPYHVTKPIVPVTLARASWARGERGRRQSPRTVARKTSAFLNEIG